MVNELIAGLEGCRAYIDDAVIFSDTWEEHVSCIQTFFMRMSQAKLTLNLVKSEFGKAQAIFLGHVVGQGKGKPKLLTLHYL